MTSPQIVRISTNEKRIQFLFEIQQCQEFDQQEMPQLEIQIRVSPTTLKDI